MTWRCHWLYHWRWNSNTCCCPLLSNSSTICTSSANCVRSSGDVGTMGGGVRRAARVPVVVANSWKLRATDGGPAGMKIVCWAEE